MRACVHACVCACVYALIAPQMGLGKTAQCVAVLESLALVAEAFATDSLLNFVHVCVCALITLQMGLGKTAQCIAVLESLRLVGNVQKPFLLVAPLTTLGHWQREIETWTDMVRLFVWASV